MWALYQVESHVPATFADGLSCDEHGCMICNEGIGAIPIMVEAMTKGLDCGPYEAPYFYTQPDDGELLEALDQLVAMFE